MGWIMAGSNGIGGSTCRHQASITKHPVTHLMGAWDCPECEAIRAVENAERAARLEEKRAAHLAGIKAAEAELRRQPPTKEEYKRYILIKQDEASAFIEEGHEEWPTEDNITLPFSGAWAGEFVEKCRKKED